MTDRSPELLAMLPTAAVIRLSGEQRPRIAIDIGTLAEVLEAAMRARDQVRSYDTGRGRDAAANAIVSRVGNILIAYEDVARVSALPAPFDEPIQRERVLPDAASPWTKDEPDTEDLMPHLNGDPATFLIELHDGRWNQLLLHRMMRAMFAYLSERCPEAAVPRPIATGFWLLFEDLRGLSETRLRVLGVPPDRHATACEHARLLLDWLLMGDQPSELRTCPWKA